MGALLLAPAAHAATGVEPVKVSLKGTGAGKAFIPEGGKYRGSPEIKCSYASPGPQTGVCETIMSDEGEGWEQVFVTVEAAPGSKFVGWVVKNTEFEGCSGTFPTCAPFVEPSGTGSGEAEIIATFDLVPPKFPLTIAKTGEGTIVSSPAGINCGSECKAEFTEGSTVTLTASPASGYAFTSWAGCTEHAGLTCKVTMAKALTVKATFTAPPSLTVEKAGSGSGKATATGISCDASCSKATAAIKTGTSVTVKTVSSKSSEAAVFEGGTGSASGCSGATCTFTISANSSVKVKFDPTPTKTLTVNLTGPAAYKGKVSGKGIVKGLLSSAIACGAGCTSQTETFPATDTVTLTALAATGYTFAGWSGSEAGTCTGKTSPCTISTSANKTLSAKFE